MEKRREGPVFVMRRLAHKTAIWEKQNLAMTSHVPFSTMVLEVRGPCVLVSCLLNTRATLPFEIVILVVNS